MVASPVTWVDVQQGLLDWVKTASGLSTVYWVGQDVPQQAYPYATLAILSGPTMQAAHERRHDAQIMIDLITIVTAAEQTYTVTVDDVAHPYAAGPSDTAEDIRDALLALLGALADITVETVSTNQIRLTGSSARPDFHTTVLPAVDITRVTSTESILTTVYVPAEITVRVQAFTDDVTPAGHARDLIAKCLIALGQEATGAALRAKCVSFQRVLTTQDLTQIVAGENESRFMMDAAFAVTMQVSEDTPWIRTADAAPTWT